MIVTGCNLIVYCGVLLYFWRKNHRPTAIVYELVTLALVTVLISPVSWRHHYILVLIPLIYMWVRLARCWRDAIVLAATTLAMGAVFPDYVVVASYKPVLDLALASLIPVTSFLLLLVLCKNYEVPEVLSLSPASTAQNLKAA